MSALRNRVNIIMACGSHTCLAVSSVQEVDASQNERQLEFFFLEGVTSRMRPGPPQYLRDEM
jgi:hypothetical protein